MNPRFIFKDSWLAICIMRSSSSHRSRYDGECHRSVLPLVISFSSVIWAAWSVGFYDRCAHIKLVENEKALSTYHQLGLSSRGQFVSVISFVAKIVTLVGLGFSTLFTHTTETFNFPLTLTPTTITPSVIAITAIVFIVVITLTASLISAASNLLPFASIPWRILPTRSLGSLLCSPRFFIIDACDF